jgi:predicted PurR-regulated permease PerM
MMLMIGIVVLLGLLVFLLWPASQLFLVSLSAILVAVLIDGLARLITHWVPIPQSLARISVIILLLVSLAGFLFTAGPAFANQMSQLTDQLPRAIDHLKTIITDQPLGRYVQNLNLDFLKPAESKILAGLTGVFSTAFEAIANFVIILVIGLYLAMQPTIYIQGALYLVPHSRRKRAQQVIDMLGHALSWWLVGRFASMVIVGIMTTIALNLIDMPLALVLGVIAGLFCFVPYIGPIVSALPAILVGLMNSPLTAMYVLIIYMVVQFIEGHFLTPFIQKRALSLPPAILLLAQFFIGTFYGLLGVLLATPIAIVIIVLVQMLYIRDIIKDPVKVLGEHHHSTG